MINYLCTVSLTTGHMMNCFYCIWLF